MNLKTMQVRILLAAMAVSCAFCYASESIGQTYSTDLDIESVKKVVNDAAQWQTNNMPSRGRYPEDNPKYTGWADGVFLSALADWTEYDDSRNLRQWYEKIANQLKWEVGHRSPNPANDISVSLMYAKIWQKHKRPRYIVKEIKRWDRKTIKALAGGWKELIPTIERLDYQMKYCPKTDNIKFEIPQNQERWCWCDALYVAAPTYALYANITGNDEYREFMNREFMVTMETLYDKEERLVFRDTRFMKKREANGKKVFWGRGNGWVIGALARVMDFLPEDYHSREKYENYFTQIMSRLVELQGSDGYWRSSLLDPKSFPSPEASATGFYTYGLWWGINNELLDKEKYLEPATRAWEAMVKAVQPSGKLGYVQAIGDTPQNVSAHSYETYGTAAFMLAGLEVSKYLTKSAATENETGSDTFSISEKSNIPKPEQIQEIVCRAADWQLAHPIITKPRTILVGDWAYGPFLNGLFAIGQMPGNEKYISELMRIGKEENWQLISSVCPANDHCTPQTYLEMYEMFGDESMLTPTRKALDAYMAVSDKQDESVDFVKKNFTKWSWCDALYMSPPTFARLAIITGDNKYLDYLHKWWWRVSDYYYDPEEHLYFRDQNFFEKREANGKKVFWSRGNGWVVGGLVRVLQYLPKNDPFRSQYEQQFKEMCTKLASIQRPDGLWSSGLLDPSHQAETSGSSFILYGLVYAMNENLIDRDQYMPVVLKAWWSLCGYVKEDGKFTGVQPIADSPGKYDQNYTMPYGVGAFLLAGSEIYKLVD